MTAIGIAVLLFLAFTAGWIAGAAYVMAYVAWKRAARRDGGGEGT